MVKLDKAGTPRLDGCHSEEKQRKSSSQYICAKIWMCLMRYFWRGVRLLTKQVKRESSLSMAGNMLEVWALTKFFVQVGRRSVSNQKLCTACSIGQWFASSQMRRHVRRRSVEVGGDDASSSVCRSIAEVMLWVGVGEVFILQEREREDNFSALGWQFLEERILQLLVAFCDVLGCRSGFDGEHFVSLGFDSFASLC
jgi:hypothetical protein